MKIEIVRSIFLEIIGTLYINGKEFCNTIEPCDKQIPAGEYKLVEGAHLIDGLPLPILKDVPDFGTVCLQNGEKDFLSKGNIGVGRFTEDEDFFIWGHSTLSGLLKILEKEWRAGREVLVEIKEEEIKKEE